jgi:hypothetical protein
MGQTIGPIVAQVWVRMSYENGVVNKGTLRGLTLTGASFAFTSEV